MKEKLQILDIAEAKVPKNMMQLLQPLDLTTNGTSKKIEKREFSSYFTKRIMQAMLKDPYSAVGWRAEGPSDFSTPRLKGVLSLLLLGLSYLEMRRCRSRRRWL